MVGVGGLTAVIAKVLNVGQNAIVGVTTTVYTVVTTLPAGMPVGVTIVFFKVPFPPTNQFVGVQEYVYWPLETGVGKFTDTATFPPGHTVGVGGGGDKFHEYISGTTLNVAPYLHDPSKPVTLYEPGVRPPTVYVLLLVGPTDAV